jgi:hypothetical protein
MSKKNASAVSTEDLKRMESGALADDELDGVAGGVTPVEAFLDGVHSVGTCNRIGDQLYLCVWKHR